MREVVIVSYARSAVGKAPKGLLKYTRPEELAGQVIKGLLARTPGLSPELVEEVVMGNAFPEAEQGVNIGRIAAALAGLPDTTAAQTVNRFCASGVQSIATAHNAILAGNIDIAIAGGVESMSTIPGGGNMNFPNPKLLAVQAGHYLSMGVTAEIVASKYNVSREKQDLMAARSHNRAEAAQKSGLFSEEIIDIEAVRPLADGSGEEKFIFNQDEGIRYGSKFEDLSKLRPVFKANGSVTAGNSSQTSDGAGFVMLMEKRTAISLGLKPLARIRAFSAVGVSPDIMGVGPMYAIPKALKQAGMTLNDIGLIELNEAFASQAIACIEALGINEEITNVNGGAIALGHPLGGSGAVLTSKLFSEMKRRNESVGMVSMCVGGGMGAAIIYEMI